MFEKKRVFLNDIISRAGEATKKIPNILIIDQSIELVELFQVVLEEEGYNVMSHPQPSLNLSEIASLAPDLIILDYFSGPQLYGPHILGALRSHPDLQTVPVLICTAAFREIRALGIHKYTFGVNYLAKPFHLRTLVDMVRTCLDGDVG